MNFLAHVALASDAAAAWQCSPEDAEGLIAGAIIGDFVKGRIPADWPVELQAGVALHRKIDALSNVHLGIQASCASYPAELRRFAPIFLDLLADHSLSRRWTEFYGDDIAVLSQASYQSVRTYQHLLPERGHRFVEYMEDVDLLANYHEWAHVQQGIRSVLRRLRRTLDTDLVMTNCAARIEETDALLSHLYPDLRRDTAQWDAFKSVG